MTLEDFNELKKRVEWGEEFIITYKKMDYWISQNREGVYLTRNSDGYTQEFSNQEQLFDEALINDKKLKDIWIEITW